MATVASKGKDRSLELLTVLSSLCLKCTTLKKRKKQTKHFSPIYINKNHPPLSLSLSYTHSHSHSRSFVSFQRQFGSATIEKNGRASYVNPIRPFTDLSIHRGSTSRSVFLEYTYICTCIHVHIGIRDSRGERGGAAAFPP